MGECDKWCEVLWAVSRLEKRYRNASHSQLTAYQHQRCEFDYNSAVNDSRCISIYLRVGHPQWFILLHMATFSSFKVSFYLDVLPIINNQNKSCIFSVSLPQCINFTKTKHWSICSALDVGQQSWQRLLRYWLISCALCNSNYLWMHMLASGENVWTWLVIVQRNPPCAPRHLFNSIKSMGATSQCNFIVQLRLDNQQSTQAADSQPCFVPASMQNLPRCIMMHLTIERFPHV